VDAAEVVVSHVKAHGRRRKPNAVQQDRKLRERLAVAYADPSIDINIQIGNLQALVTWVKEGRTPPGVKPVLTVVENKAG
jgi:hypothetical protein